MTITPEATLPRPRLAQPILAARHAGARRFQLSVRTPRELVVPLLTPILFALVIAPALKQALHTSSRLRGVRRHRHDRPADPAQHDVRRAWA